MRKTFKLIGLCLVAIAMSVNFSACTEDEEEENNNGGGNGGTPARQAMSTSGRNIKTLSINSGGYEDDAVANFTYDAQGRVVQESILADGELLVTTYEYNEGTVVATRSIDNNIHYSTIVYTLAPGRDISSEETDSDVPEASYTLSYQYQNGCLTAIGESGYMSTYTWSDGNLTGMDDGEVEVAYNTDNCTGKVELWLLASFDDLSMALQGYFGNGTKNRPISVTNHYAEATFTISYEVDSYGDPTTITTTYGGISETLNIVWE